MKDDSDDFFIEDVLRNANRSKKVNSKTKGARGERELCKILSQAFPDKNAFFRVVGSGNRWSQVQLTEQAKAVLTSDLVCPDGFKFSIECKYGYKDVDIFAIFDGSCKELDNFLTQAQTDADRIGKEPMLCWKKPRMAWLAFVKRHIIPSCLTFPCQLIYKEWIAVLLTDLVQHKSLFFDE